MIESTPISIPTSPAEDAAPAAAASPRKRWIGLLKLALTLIVVYYVARALIVQFQAVPWDQLHLTPGYAALSVLCTFIVHGGQLLVVVTLLRAYGHRLPWRAQLAAAWVPPLGKYVPGKVASIAGAVYIQRQYGIPGTVAVSVALMLDGLALIAGLIVSTPLLLSEPVRREMPHAWAWCIALAACGLLALHPRVFSALVNLGLRMIGRPRLTTIPSAKVYAIPVALSFSQWLFSGLALWFMIRSIIDVSIAQIPLFIAVAALAMSVSYLALFAPGGLGVREWIFFVALGPTIGPVAAVVAVAMRVAQTLIELTLAAFGFAALRSERGRAVTREESTASAALRPGHSTT
ncbi:MAG TPA: lysylphosphatidylglycerol synthase domain-containing protein [Tepidisphaeraceae bacterium]|nr:lysylphosphatidylglycerol synthase domain-containing protein [Tepidisphaeraceae bacterium]